MKCLWLFMFVTVILGCTEVVPGTCYQNPTGGAGGAGSMPIGADVGASASGDYATEPPKQPQDATDPPPGCYGPPDATEQGTYIRCRGVDVMTCVEMCYDIGATCAPLRTHPYGSMGGNGMLRQCMSNTLGRTCTYCYPNGDVCSWMYEMGVEIRNFCSYTGGKGCD